MITFETIGKLELATLKEGDLVQVLGEFSEGDVALMTGKVYPALHDSFNRLVTIANGLKVEVFPTPLGDKDVTKKYVNERDDKIKEQVNNLHTKRNAIEWRSGLRVTDELQLYVHDGVEYLPDSGAVPFTTDSAFNADNWVLSELMTQMKHWKENHDIRGWNYPLFPSHTCINAMIAEGILDIHLPQGIVEFDGAKITNKGGLSLIGVGTNAPTTHAEPVENFIEGATALKMTGTGAGILQYAVPNFESWNMRLQDLIITSDETVLNQHALVMSDHVFAFELDNVVFANITGYCWLWDTNTANPYSQNIVWRNVSFFNVGGIMGNNRHEKPFNNALFCTLMTIDNVNLDNCINDKSPQPYIIDFRGVREITGSCLLLEGDNPDNAVARQYIAIGSDGAIDLTNVHLEMLTNKPQNWFTFMNTSGAEYYGDSNVTVKINALECAHAAKFEFNGNSKAQVRIEGFRCQQQLPKKYEDWVVFESPYRGSSLQIDDYDSRQGFKSLVPESLKGKLQVTASASTSASGNAIPASHAPITSQQAIPLFKWRASDGTFESASKPSAYGAIKADAGHTYNNEVFQGAKVCKITQSNSRPSLGFDFKVPPHLKGATITMVARYFWNSDRDFTLFNVYDPLITVGHEFLNSENKKVWTTEVATFIAHSDTIFVKSTTSASGGAAALYLAGYDIYLGSTYVEPYDY